MLEQVDLICGSEDNTAERDTRDENGERDDSSDGDCQDTSTYTRWMAQSPDSAKSAQHRVLCAASQRDPPLSLMVSYI